MSSRYLDLARGAMRAAKPVPDPAHRVLVLPPELPRRAVPADSSTCPACHGSAFWISLAQVRICERCHPPADARIVARREGARATTAQDGRTAEGPDRGTPSGTNTSGGAA
jgi:hypothetical protein